jgi:uncharacterized protein YdaU (DUF1376 family)
MACGGSHTVSLPWFPFYVDDFLASPKVRRMDARAVGTYLLLMCEQFQQGAVDTSDMDELASITKSTPEVVHKVLESCFEQDADGWRNRRLQSVMAEQEARSNKARASAKARWDKASDANAMRTQIRSECYPQPQPQPEATTTAPASPTRSVENSGREDERPQEATPDGSAETIAGRPTYTLAALAEAARVKLGLGIIPRDDDEANKRILREWFYAGAGKRDPEDIMLAIEGAADMRDKDLIGWDSAKPGAPMTLKALQKASTLDHTGDGAVRYLYDVARDHQRKREEADLARTPPTTARVKGSPMKPPTALIPQHGRAG